VSASPLPERYAVELPRREERGGGTAWYVAERWSPNDFGEIRGGPYETEAEAQAAIDAWHRELDALYDAINGPGVAWGPEPAQAGGVASRAYT